MAVKLRERTVVVALLLVFGLAAIAAGYLFLHDQLWNRGPVNAVFHAADAPDRENSVGVTSQVRALFPDGTARTVVDAALAADGFACAPDPADAETVCRRSPFGIVCTQTWFVRYADMTADAVRVTHASKQLRCG